MTCPICGRENEAKSKKCIHCGTVFRVYRTSLKSQQKNRQKIGFPWIKALCFVLMLFVTAGTVIFLLPGTDPEPSVPALLTPPDPPKNTIPIGTPPPTPQVTPPVLAQQYIAVTHNIEVGTHAGSSYAAYDTELLPIASYGIVDKASAPSLDGSARAVLTEDKQLLLIRNGNITRIASKVVDFKLSAMGTSVAYVFSMRDIEYSLCIYDSEKAQAYQILVQRYMPDYCISPDGKTLAFRSFDQTTNQYTLYTWTDGEIQFAATNWGSLLTVSNNGTYIYTEDDGALFCYHKNAYNWLGNDTSNYCLNADHSVIVFQKDGNTFMCSDGENVQRFETFCTKFVLPINTRNRPESNTGNNYTTYPFYDFHNTFYYNKSLPHPKYYIDSSGQLLFYVESNNLFAVSLTNDATPTLLSSAFYPNGFALSSTIGNNTATIRYSMLLGESLYLFDLNGQATRINSNIQQQNILCTFDQFSNFYYLQDRILYQCNGGTPYYVSSDVISMVTCPNGLILVQTSEGLNILDGVSLIPFLPIIEIPEHE